MLSSIIIIGAGGQTGQLFVKEIAGKIKNIHIEAVIRQNQREKLINIFPNSVTLSSDLRTSLKRESEVIILATPNPTAEVIEIIAEEVKKPLIIVLPQNGVNVVPTAEKILAEKKVSNFFLVRASLFTTVSISKEGKAVYNQDKLRIAIAPVIDSPTKAKTSRLKELFEKAGFDAAVFDNYRSMEWTKLFVNCLGSTAAITGFTPRETFRDERLFELEVRAMKDRLSIMRADGIPFARIPWQNISLLPIIGFLPISILRKGKAIIAELMAKGRENNQPAAARKIMEGKPTELAYYHKPIIDTGQLHGLRSPVDEAILEVITEHERGIVNLTSLTKQERRDLLLKAYHVGLQKPYVCRNPFKTSIVEGMSCLFSRGLAVSGVENLKAVRENLNKGKSVLILANHLSHADHPTLGRALRQNGFADLANRLIFVAGMRFKDEFLAKVFNNAYARILVSTPTSAPQTEEENRESQMVNLKGFFEASRLLNKGSLLVIYPEGTRSRERKLLKAIPTVARYLENQNVGIILPVGIQGTGDLLPVGKKIMRFRQTKISFGKPISPASLIDSVLRGLTTEKRSNYKRDKKIRDEINEKIMDFVMKKISELLPEEQRGVYK